MKDLTNLDVTAPGKDALDLYNHAVTKLCYFRSPIETIIKLLNSQPDFVMAQVFNGHINLWTTDRNNASWSARSYDAISKLDHSSLNARERMHVAAIKTWVDGNLIEASRLLDEILIDYPHDILALLSGHQIDFFLGDAVNLRDRISRALPSWDKEHPLYGFLLGMLSFGQEEAGHYELAEETALQAVALNSKDVWSIHAVAHALEMQNKAESGKKFMHENESNWNSENFFIAHNAVHYDLFLLETNDLDIAVDVYDKYIFQEGSDSAVLNLVDASSVLWRLYLEGTDVGGRINALADAWKDKCNQNFYAFNEAHAMMAFASGNDHEAARKLLESMKEYVNSNDDSTTNHINTRKIGLPVSEAIYEFSLGNFDRTLEILMPIKNSVHQFGGSHAQRDAVARTLLEAAIRSRQKRISTALINERLVARPNSLYNRNKLEQVNAIA